MKKAISVIIAAVICLTCVIPAFADISGPMFKEYEAYIINPDGFTFSDYDFDTEEDIEITLPYNTEITVTGEYTDESGEAYAQFLYESVSGGSISPEIPLKDISKVKSEVDTSEAVKLDHPLKYVVMAKDGAKIRKGPAESYDEVGTIPYDTEITVEYSTHDSDQTECWSYCTYNGVSGWINTVQAGYSYEFKAVLTEGSGRTGKIITAKDGLRLTDKPGYVYDDDTDLELSEEEKAEYVSEEIPAGTEFTYSFYYKTANVLFAYVEFNGVSGWLGCCYSTSSLASDEVSNDIIRDFLIYDGPADIYSEQYGAGEKLGTIPEGGIVLGYLNINKLVSKTDGSDLPDYDWENPQYEEDDCSILRTYYVEYNGIKGWITCRDDSGFNVTVLSNYESIKFPEDTDVFTDTSLSEKTGTVPAGTECHLVGEIWYNDSEVSEIIIYNGKPAYISIDADYEYGNDTKALSREEIETALTGAPLEIDYSIVNFRPDTENEGTEETKAEADTAKGIKTTVIVIVAAVIIVFIAALVTIILIKKKKSGKKEESKPEEKE